MPLGWNGLLLAAAFAPQTVESVPSPPAPPRLDSLGGPTANPATWVTNDDYPVTALRERSEGTTGFRLSYDAAGVPWKCDIISSSGHADLDRATCDLTMQRARFRPGKGAAGEPIGGTYSTRVRWAIPNQRPGQLGPLPFPDPGHMTLDYTVDTDGAVTQCQGHVEGLIDEGGHRKLAVDPCREIRAMGPYPPPRDAAGKPVARRYRMNLDVAIDDIEPQGETAK